MKYVLNTICVAVVVLALLFTAQAEGQSQPAYVDTYTPEELAALEQALWAGNMTLDDLSFRKDLTEGHGCYPIVKVMMYDPLRIAEWMDLVAARTANNLELNRDLNHVIHDCIIYPEGMSSGEWGFGSQFINVGSMDDLAEGLDDSLEVAVDQLPEFWTSEELNYLRGVITTKLAWHSFEQELGNTGYAAAKANSDADIYALLNNYIPVLSGNDPWAALLGKAIDGELPESAFPTDAPFIRDTHNGRICIGTMGDDYYEGDFAVLIDPGGNDTYHNCRIGAAFGKRTHAARLGPDGEPTGASADWSPLGDGRVAFFADLGGDDFYDCADVDITLGAAVLGVAAFYDLGGGDDRYYGGYCSLGAAMGGIATFYDDGGCDYYSGKTYTQGAAGFGIGIMVDDSVADAPVFDTAEGNDALIDSYANGESDTDTHNLQDNDYYTAWSEAQAFARPRGVAMCINRRGNEIYHAGGVYTDAPLFSDRYQSFSQGFAIGERGIDWAGGIAMLIDYDGNDRYLGDIYNQGVGYWYGAGLLWDGGGNDSYEMTQYGQGSGIHLAIGGLVDVSGHDTYVMHSGLGQGSSHDLAASILHDRGGDDRYDGNTTCNGSALAGSVGLFIDRSGNDTYAGRRNSINTGDNRRTNVGVFADLGGDDDYMSQVMADGQVWTQANIGMGVDVTPPPVEEEATTATAGGPGQLSTEEANIPIPEVCSYEGELSQDVFDELWEIAVRWEVGDNRIIVPHARDRLIEFGTDVLPYLSEVMDDSNSGLALRAFQDIYQALWEVDAEAVGNVLRENAANMDDQTRRNNALYLIGEMGHEELADVAVTMLDDPVPSLQRRAIGVLGKLLCYDANDRLIAMLDPKTNDELVINAAMTTLTDLEVDCYNELRPLLEYPQVSVREQLVKQFVKHWDFYSDHLRKDIFIEAAYPLYSDVQLKGALPDYEWVLAWHENPLGLVGKRSILHILVQADVPSFEGLDFPETFWVSELGDWGFRGDLVRVILHWNELMEDPEKLTERADWHHYDWLALLDGILANESHPYVLMCAEQ